jgi:hypothetical protein
VIDRLRRQLPDAFNDGDFEHHAETVGQLPRPTAHTLFRTLVDDGQIGRDPEGLWRWIR